MSVLEVVQLLNHLEVNVDDMKGKNQWGGLLVNVMYMPTGLENLSSHYWHLLDKHKLSPAASILQARSTPLSAVARSLDKAKDWEKLEIWMVAVAWQLVVFKGHIMEDIEQVTLGLLSQQPSALPRFKNLCAPGTFMSDPWHKLRSICIQVQEQQSPSESPPP